VPPVKRFVWFSKKIATCYDTHYQKNILKQRPKKDFEWWSDENYIPRKRFLDRFKRGTIPLCRESLIDNESEHDTISQGEHIEA
jgi:hypothetical protein